MIEIIVRGGLFVLAKDKWNAKKFAEAFATADVKVHCSCPDFYWSGMKYNLGSKGHLKGHALPISSGYKNETDDVTYAPNVRDPHRRHVLCKHLLTVVSKIHANAFTIMKDAKTMNAAPVSPTLVTQTEKNKQVGAKKIINETKQEKVRKTITENFAKSVINLHESGKLDDKPVDPTEIVPTQSDETTNLDTNVVDGVVNDTNNQPEPELVDISNVGMDDVDVDSIVGTNDQTVDTPDVIEPVEETNPNEIINTTNTKPE